MISKKCFAEIKLTSNYKKERPSTTEKSLIKPSTMMFGLITYALNSILSVLIT